MPTSHRSDQRAALPRSVLVLVALLVIVVLAAVAYVLLGLVTASPDHSTGSDGSAPSAATTATATPGGSDGKSGTGQDGNDRGAKPGNPTHRAAPLTRVTATPPHQLSIGTVISDVPFGNAITPTQGRLIPDAVDELQRLGARGIPGSPGTDTVVVVGASSTSGRGALDGIDAVGSGDQIVLDSQNARLTYEVTGVSGVDATKVLSLPAVTGKHTDRLVIDCAHYEDSQRVGPDLVVVATLVRAEPLRP